MEKEALKHMGDEEQSSGLIKIPASNIFTSAQNEYGVDTPKFMKRGSKSLKTSPIKVIQSPSNKKGLVKQNTLDRSVRLNNRKHRDFTDDSPKILRNSEKKTQKSMNTLQYMISPSKKKSFGTWIDQNQQLDKESNNHKPNIQVDKKPIYNSSPTKSKKNAENQKSNNDISTKSIKNLPTNSRLILPSPSSNLNKSQTKLAIYKPDKAVNTFKVKNDLSDCLSVRSKSLVEIDINKKHLGIRTQHHNQYDKKKKSVMSTLQNIVGGKRSSNIDIKSRTTLQAAEEQEKKDFNHLVFESKYLNWFSKFQTSIFIMLNKILKTTQKEKKMIEIPKKSKLLKGVLVEGGFGTMKKDHLRDIRNKKNAKGLQYSESLSLESEDLLNFELERDAYIFLEFATKKMTKYLLYHIHINDDLYFENVM